MEIEGIRNNLYNNNGGYQRSRHAHIIKKKVSAQAVPFDAVTFEPVQQNDQIDQERMERMKLADYINALPDEEVSRRMKKFNRSFDDAESAIAEKLIMDSL